MWVLVIASLIAIWLTYRESVGKSKKGMYYAFLILTLIQALHYDFGNDYMAYYRAYKEMTLFGFDFTRLQEGYYYRDPGWALLNFAFKPLGGFFTLVAVISIYINIVYYKFIRKYVAKDLWFFAVALYLLMVHDFYVINMSMLRQGLTVAMCLSTFPWIEKRKFVPAIIVVMAASTIHSSAIIFIPFIFVDYLPLHKTGYLGIGLIASFLLLFLSAEALQYVFDQMLITEEFSEFAETYEERSEASTKYGMGFILKTIPMFLMATTLIFEKKLNRQLKLLLFLACIGTMVAPFGKIIQMVSRIGIYFNAFSLAAIPFAYNNIKEKYLRLGCLGLLALVILFDYYQFFSPSSIYAHGYEEYHTIFSALKDF